MNASERADILLEAADYIDAHGWHQGAFADDIYAETPKCCAAGAIAMVQIGKPGEIVGDTDAIVDFSNFVRRQPFNHFGLMLGTWNDFVATTKEEVTTAMRDCAKQLRTKESA